MGSFRTKLISTALASLVSLATGVANADTIIFATDQGFYNSLDGSGVGGSVSTDTRIQTGVADLGPGGLLYYHNFFTFDLSPLAGQNVTAGTLEINGKGFGTGKIEAYEIFDYSGSIVNLINGVGGAAGLSIFNDLASGNSYGQATSLGQPGVDTTGCIDGFGCPMPDVFVQLSPAALTNINSLLQLGLVYDFVIGGNCTTCAAETEESAFLWSLISRSPGDIRIHFEVADTTSPVPLPAGLPLFAGGLGLMGWLARRKRKQAAYA